MGEGGLGSVHRNVLRRNVSIPCLGLFGLVSDWVVKVCVRVCVCVGACICARAYVETTHN